MGFRVRFKGDIQGFTWILREFQEVSRGPRDFQKSFERVSDALFKTHLNPLIFFEKLQNTFRNLLKLFLDPLKLLKPFETPLKSIRVPQIIKTDLISLKGS